MATPSTAVQVELAAFWERFARSMADKGHTNT